MKRDTRSMVPVHLGRSVPKLPKSKLAFAGSNVAYCSAAGGVGDFQRGFPNLC